jgi:hypothetical protein
MIAPRKRDGRQNSSELNLRANALHDHRTLEPLIVIVRATIR